MINRNIRILMAKTPWLSLIFAIFVKFPDFLQVLINSAKIPDFSGRLATLDQLVGTSFIFETFQLQNL